VVIWAYRRQWINNEFGAHILYNSVYFKQTGNMNTALSSIFGTEMSKIKIKQSHYMPEQALRFPGFRGFQISRQSTHEGSKVVSPTHRPPLHLGKHSWYSFLIEAESIPGPYCDRKDYANEKFQ
jgi:hypothetical protein